MTTLNAEQKKRYARQITLAEVGTVGQEALLRASVVIIGTGGLGTIVAQYLAAAGIGRIGLVDRDRVELSNLQRQILHYTPDLNRPKVDSAAEKLSLLNPDIQIDKYPIYVNASNIQSILEKYDYIIDGLDNFAGKFLINDACVLLKKPFSHAGVLGFLGQLFTYLPDHDFGCYRCLFQGPPSPEKVPSPEQIGILGVLPGVIGLLQAQEVLKYFLQTGELLTNRLLTYDGKRATFREVAFKKNQTCPVCGRHPTISTLSDEL